MDQHVTRTYLYAAHAAATDFPLTLEALQEWDAIILGHWRQYAAAASGHWLKSRRTANRLTLLHDYVAGGGADDDRRLLQLRESTARATAIPRWRKCCRYAAAWDDRIETPEGCYAEVTESHPV